MRAGLKQTHLAERLGKPQSFVSKYEHGERMLNIVEFLWIARAMGADPAAIITEFESRRPVDESDPL